MTHTMAYLVAAIAGALIWFGTSELTGRREVWDAAQYWLLASTAATNRRNSGAA